MTYPSNTPPIATLADELAQLKNAEDDAKLARVRKELEILEHPDVATVMKDEGTTSVGPLTITTGFTRKWNQAQLTQLAKGIEPAWFPFKTEFKEDRAAARVTEERTPELWNSIREALTLTPRKPAVSIKPAKKAAA